MLETQYKVKIHHECAPGETECEHLSIFCLKTSPSSITDQETGKELFSRTLLSLIGTQEMKGKKHHIQKEDSSAVLSKVAVIVQISLLRHQIIVISSLLFLPRYRERKENNGRIIVGRAVDITRKNISKLIKI